MILDLNTAKKTVELLLQINAIKLNPKKYLGHHNNRDRLSKVKKDTWQFSKSSILAFRFIFQCSQIFKFLESNLYDSN